MSKTNKILFIAPSSYDENGTLIKAKKAHQPARVIPYLAALTPSEYSIKLVDELVEPLDFESDADLIVLTGMIKHMPRAIDIAKIFRKKGKITIIGGVAAYALFERITDHFDSVVIGEIDHRWPELLEDWKNNNLKPSYEFKDAPDITTTPFARYDLLNWKKYLKPPNDRKHPITLIETSRGCPYNCSYCLVSRFFGRKMRYRDIGNVIDEIKHHGAKMISFADDNFLINPDRSREMLKAIKPLGIKWFAQVDANIIKQPELLQLMKDSGCLTVLVGIESIVPENLKEMNKSSLSRKGLREITEVFKKHEIPLMASMIFGMDHDTVESIDQTFDMLDEAQVEVLIPWILTPAPKTPIHDIYTSENRLLHENFNLYDHSHPVVTPKNISVEDLWQAYQKGLRRFYRLGNSYKLLFKQPRNNFHLFVMHLHYRKHVWAGRHPLCY
jgi:radical SAM superfamily enzyme YgiQ (UPF0313 family)